MAMRVLLSSSLLVCFIFVLALNAGAFDESVILYLSFDGQNAKKAIDQTGNGNDGILKGNVKWAKNGKVNGAVSFDRSAGTFVEIPDNKVLDSLTKSTTMEAWVKTNVAAGGFGDDQILGKYANPKPNETTIMFISARDYAGGQGGAKAVSYTHRRAPET